MLRGDSWLRSALMCFLHFLWRPKREEGLTVEISFEKGERERTRLDWQPGRRWVMISSSDRRGTRRQSPRLLEERPPKKKGKRRGKGRSHEWFPRWMAQTGSDLVFLFEVWKGVLATRKRGQRDGQDRLISCFPRPWRLETRRNSPPLAAIYASPQSTRARVGDRRERGKGRGPLDQQEARRAKCECKEASNPGHIQQAKSQVTEMVCFWFLLVAFG